MDGLGVEIYDGIFDRFKNIKQLCEECNKYCVDEILKKYFDKIVLKNYFGKIDKLAIDMSNFAENDLKNKNEILSNILIIVMKLTFNISRIIGIAYLKLYEYTLDEKIEEVVMFYDNTFELWKDVEKYTNENDYINIKIDFDFFKKIKQTL